MYCSNCGMQNPEGATFCSGCGQKINSISAPHNHGMNYTSSEKTNNVSGDTGLYVWMAVSFFIPIVGLIQYFRWKSLSPEKANKVIAAAGIGFIFNFFILMMS